MAQDPKSIGRYQVLNLLGRGGMGSVFRCTDPLLKRQVVVKVVHEGGAGFAHALERFQREAEISARLNHPNIITVHDVGEDPATGPFIAMEFVEGATLATLIQGRTLEAEAGMKILVQAARGLAAAGREGIVHRDVKPENILVGRDGRVKLTDFGIARTGESRLTTVGGVFGTPSYIAPELLSDAEASPVTDTYAFAVTAFELLTGALPFKGDSVASTLLRIVNDPPAVPETLAPAPRAVLLRALSKRPAERFPDVLAFMSALVQACPMAAGTRARLATLLSGEDLAVGAVQSGPVPAATRVPGGATPLPSAQFPPPQPTPPPASQVPPTPEPVAPLVPPRPPTPPAPLETRVMAGPPPGLEPTPGEPLPRLPQPSTGSGGALKALAASTTGALLLGGGIFLGVRNLGARELSLDTDPSGAVVRIDGREAGRTPLLRARVAKGARRLELLLPGFEPRALDLRPEDRDLKVVALAPLAAAADPAGDPELEAMRRKVKDLEAQSRAEADRLKRLREKGPEATPASASAAAPSAEVRAQAPVQMPVLPAAPAPMPAPAVSMPEEAVRTTAPTVLRTITPTYPSRAVAARFEPRRSHRVVLRVQVDEAGRPGVVQVVEGVPGPYGFNEAAREAALGCTYAPGSRGGRPAGGWVELAFVFQPPRR